ncbi:MAG: M20/M25/M40 family metallo-hydrolase [Acidobacteriota bacterium]|nr:M20/M25/M40 family metallo-hydrolase [Acidobacteriota bacterium]
MTRLSIYQRLNFQVFVAAILIIAVISFIFGTITSFAESNKELQNQSSGSVLSKQTSGKTDDESAKPFSNRWITVDENEFAHIQSVIQSKGGNFDLDIVERRYGLSVIKIDESQLLDLSRKMHDEFHKCGGFISHETLDAARLSIEESLQVNSNQQLADYTINNQTNVNPMLSETKEAQIREIITRLSTDFPNRRYNQPSGLDSANWIKNKWTELAAGRSDITVEFFNHPANVSPQPSIILTVQGTVFPNEVVILGGHQDSINSGGAALNAPGADDDASGIASLTETIRVMVNKNFRPQRTVKFMAYAAEEIGLVGSNAIATDFKARGVNVVGVLQLDMTNYKSTSSPVDIAIVTDLTNAAQNQFLRDLIATYQPTLLVGNSSCGYGCSDHVSWNNKGFPASFPFEGVYSNPTIHTTNDTLAQSGNTANHAVKFTNLALSYLGELAKGTLGSITPTPTPTISPTPTITPTPTPTPGGRINVALAANGGIATASSFLTNALPDKAIDGIRNWATSGAWKDATPDVFPDFLQVDFSGSKTINEIAVFAVKDNFSNPSDPTDAETFNYYGLTSFDVQYWNGSSWTIVPNGNIVNTNKVVTKLVFPAVTTTKVRIVAITAQANYSRVVELEAWSSGTVTSTPTPTPGSTPTATPTPTITPTPSPTPGVRTNVALASNGGLATSSSQLSGGAPNLAIDGFRNWATGGTWKDATPDSFPDSLQIDFNGNKTINEIVVYGVKDDFSNPTDPTDTETFNYYGLTSFDVQYWNGSNWVTVPGGSVVGNNKVVTRLSFAAVMTTKIRVIVNSALASYSRIVEVEVWSGGETTTPTPTPTPTPTVTPTPTPGVRTNVASAANGGLASSSSQLSGGAPNLAINGVRNWATGGTWKDATPDNFPDWLQVDFSGNKTINEIVVYGVKDDFSNPTDPTDSEIFNYYGLTSFDVQYWNGSGWATVPGGSVAGNNKVVTKIVFPAITTTKIRIVVNGAMANYSRIVELEAWSSVSNYEMQNFALNLHNSKDNIENFIGAQSSIFNFLFGN